MLHLCMPAASQELAKSTSPAIRTQKSRISLPDARVVLLASAPDPLQVRGSEAVQIAEAAHVAPAAQEEPDFTGLTIALNCCFTASGQPAHAVFKQERKVSITSQLLLPTALGTAAK